MVEIGEILFFFLSGIKSTPDFRRILYRMCAYLLFTLLLASPLAHSKFDPKIRWETVHSEHFRVHSPPTYRRFVSRLTEHLEEAYRVLSSELEWTPASKIEVVVRGDTDLPNGVASVFPMNRLIVHAVPFLPIGSLGEYDDWIRTLAFHELTHILANDMTHGWVDVVRTLFGSVGKLNSFQPRWAMEGLATYIETAHGRRGRGRSAFADAVLRTAARDGLLEGTQTTLGVDLDRLNDGVPEWPGGMTPYLYGYVMNAILAESGGPRAPVRAPTVSARHLPFSVDAVTREVSGKDVESLWNQARSRVSTIAQEDLSRIRSLPVSEVTPLTRSGRWTRGPLLSEDGGSVFMIRDSFQDGLSLSVLDRASGTVEHLLRWRFPAGSRLRRAPGGRIVYSRLRQHQQYRWFSDAYLFDPVTRSEERITTGARAWDPDASADFVWDEKRGVTAGALVYVKNLDDGNQAIAWLGPKGERIIHRGSSFERLSLPVLGVGVAKGWVIFSVRGVETPGEEIRAVSLGEPPVVRTLVRRMEIATTPDQARDGDLLFAGGNTGVQNAYRVSAADLAKALSGVPAAPPRVITNVETSVLFPSKWPGTPGPELIATVLGEAGYEVSGLGTIDLPSKTEPPKLAPLHEKLSATGGPGERSSGIGEQTAGSVLPRAEPGSFSVFPAIWPKYWLMNGRIVPDGVELGVSTAGHDALELNHYDVFAAWDSRAGFPVYSVEYRYEGLYPSLRLSRRQENKYVGELARSNRVETNHLTLTYPIREWAVGFGGTHTTSRFFEDTATGGGLRTSLSYQEFFMSPGSIDPETGDAGLAASVVLTGVIAGIEQYPSVEVYFEQRVRSPVRRHFLRLVAQGAYSGNDSLSALYFVGGGEQNISFSQPFLVRGFRPGAIYGRSIGTLNAEYWMPLKEIFRGDGAGPIFNQRTKLRLLVDTGSAEYLGRERTRFEKWPVGVGAHLMHDLTLFYHFPATLSMGLNQGIGQRLGGETQLVFGVSTGLLGD